MAGPISGYDPVTGRGLTYEELYAKNKAEAQPVFQGAFGTSSTGYTPGAGGSGQGIGLFGGGGFPNGGGFGNEDLQALYDAGPGYIPWDNPNAPRAMGGSGVPNYLAGLTGSGNMNPYNAGWNPMGNEGNAYGRRYLGAGQQVTAPPMGPDAAAALAARLSAPARTPATPVAGGATPPATGSTPAGNKIPEQAIKPDLGTAGGHQKILYNSAHEPTYQWDQGKGQYVPYAGGTGTQSGSLSAEQLNRQAGGGGVAGGDVSKTYNQATGQYVDRGGGSPAYTGSSQMFPDEGTPAVSGGSLAYTGGGGYPGSYVPDSGPMGEYGSSGAPTTYGGFQMGASTPQYQTQGPMGGYGGSWKQPNQTNPMRQPRSQSDQLTTRTGGQARMTY